MNKLDRVISIIRALKEEGAMMTTGSTTGAPGFSGKADPKGPVAGYDPVMPSPKKYIYGGKGSRFRWMQKRKK